MSEFNYMTPDEVLLHVARGEEFKSVQSKYLMSPEQFKRLKASLDHYLEEGELYFVGDQLTKVIEV